MDARRNEIWYNMEPPDTIAIVATGPSLRDYDCSKISADLVIAVNSAIELIKPDIWFTLDMSSSNKVILETPVDGVRFIAAVRESVHTPSFVERLRRIEAPENPAPEKRYGAKYWMWRWRAMPRLSEDKNAVHTGNSAYGALNLAYHFRPKKAIILFGVDGTSEERVTGGKPNCLEHLPMLFESAVPQLKKADIQVINASLHSKIECFPRIAVVSALRGVV